MYKEFKNLKPLLTDFSDCPEIFAKIFEENTNIGRPITTILEIGVFNINHVNESLKDNVGQSTKTLFILQHYFKSDIKQFISADIDNCEDTITRCKSWCQQYNIFVDNHKFVQCRSLDLNIEYMFPNGIDFIFLDTSHDSDYPQRQLNFEDAGGAGMTYREICYFSNYLSLNGHLIIHDTNNFYVDRKKGFNTQGAIEKFIEENKQEFVFHEYMPNNNGLGEIIRKKSDIFNRRNKIK